MKIGFLVEGNGDKAAVEAVARRLLPRGVRFHTIRLGGKPALGTAYTSVFDLLGMGYDHVVILINALSSDERTAGDDRIRVESGLAEHRLQEHATVIVAVPDTAAWTKEGAAEANASLKRFASVLSRLTSAVAKR